MNPSFVIARKRDGHSLTRDEIEFFIRGATDGSWADYQLTALLMAIFLRGMSPAETAWLMESVVRSGTVADLSGVRRPKVDKHSTGGVGDKISLHLVPMVAACGAAVPQISGRGLGHTGGTLDKLEAIPGLRVDLSVAEFCVQVAGVGAAMIAQSAELCPAEKRLYALRDVTATVECMPLISACIMAKKIAEGCEALVLDVKFGGGAFMKDKRRASGLAAMLAGLGRKAKKPVRAVLTAMEQPLGKAVGNALEVAESIACLKGEGPPDVMEVTFALGEQMLLLAKVAKRPADARALLESSLSSGAALAKFRELVAAQGGDPRVVDHPGLLPQARLQERVVARKGGYIQRVDAMGVALAALRLGAGRTKAEDRVDPAVGISQLAKVGEQIAAGETLALVHANDETALAEACRMVKSAMVVGARRPARPKLIGGIIS